MPVEIANGTAVDFNNNGIDDECDPDCDGNGVPDSRNRSRIFRLQLNLIPTPARS